MVVNFSIVPLDRGISLSPYIAEVIKIVEKSGLKYHLNSMGTEIEGNWDEVMGVIKKAHHTLRSESPRVLTSIQIDDRLGEIHSLEGKKESVEKVVGHTLH